MGAHSSLPLGSCNCHLHIIDPAFPNNGKAKEQEGTIDQYMVIAKEQGLDRAVFVQAKPFGFDNSCLVDAIQRFGPENSRGIAVIPNNVTEEEINRLHQAGVRGVRFSLWNPKNAVVSFEMSKIIAAKIKPFGWHIQFFMRSSQFMEHLSAIKKLDIPLVFDHMGGLDPKLSSKDPAFEEICRMIDKGNAWIKLSGPYLNSSTGKPWDDAAVTARAYVRYAPERVVWGSDFPNVTEKGLLSPWDLRNTIDQWFLTEKEKTLALVENPAQLYF